VSRRAAAALPARKLAHATQTVTINPVALEADPSGNVGSALAIGAPATGGTVSIMPGTNGAPIAVSIGNAAQQIPTPPAGSSITHLLVYGHGGSTIIKEVANSNGPVTIPAILFGGTGTNTISAAGSSADNILVGGAGKDVLTGGSGRAARTARISSIRKR
jgi:Ca2+-binding RTX toxin-like protein